MPLKPSKTIAMLVYPGFNLREMVGTAHLLMSALSIRGYRLVTVGETTAPLDSDTPMQIVPGATNANLPSPGAVIVPGSSTRPDQALNSPGMLEYLRQVEPTASWMVGISSGVLALAEAGLLQKEATTHWVCAKRLEQMGIRYVRRPFTGAVPRYTAAGVSGGMDLALHLAGQIAGAGAARTAQAIAEYDPQPQLGGIDWETFDRDGTPSIPAPGLSTKATIIALVIYPGLTVPDLAGPLQVYSTLTRLDPRFQVYVVAETGEPVLTDLGVPMIPNLSFAELPDPDVFIVPGGDTATLRAMNNPAVRAYITAAAETAQVAGSACTGALILAGSGLLEERQATTHWAYVKILEVLGAHYQRKRWVEDGKFFMSAGVSAGIDAALEMVRRLAGEQVSRRVQLEIQYDPHPPLGGIDWQNPSLFLRAIRLANALRVPFVTSKAKRMARQTNEKGQSIGRA